jgi:uncharacterized membrane protein
MVASGHWSVTPSVLPFPPKEPSMTLTLYIATATVFLILDAIMLTFVMKPLFTRHIGPLMAEPIRIAPAALFYLAYVAGLIYLVSLPAIKTGSPIVLPALVIGLMAYGTYEFTSWSIMKNWHWQMVAADVTWGGVLTALSAWAGVTITRLIHG